MADVSGVSEALLETRTSLDHHLETVKYWRNFIVGKSKIPG